MKIRVLHITSRADIGGGPKHVLDLTSKMKELYPDIEIFIASPDEAPFSSRYQKVANKWHQIPKRKVTIKSLFDLKAFCKQNKINLIHSHGRGAGYFSRFLKLTTRIKVIHTFHGIHSLPGVTERIKLFIDKLFSGQTDRFICVSDNEKEKAVELGVVTADKIQVIYNGVDIRAIKDEFDRSIRESSDIFTIGTLARFDYIKGIDILLEFFHQYFQENPKKKVRILVAGDGSEQEKLEHKRKEHGLEEKVLFVGRTDNPIHFLKQLDLYISFSRMEGMPLSVLEAIATETPCLLSDVVGHRQLSRDLLCPTFSLEDVNTFINETDKAMTLRSSKSNSEKLQLSYSIEAMVHSTIQTYYSVQTPYVG